jgi:AcrR family transcriptional regulator
MLNDQTIRARAIRAALAAAEERGWLRLGMPDIAAKAGISLADLAHEFRSKPEILDAFASEVDQTVLRKAKPDPQEPARDRLFDVLMTRFEVLAPYRPALRRILGDLRASPGECVRALSGAARSQAWMLRAAGIDADGPSACLRVPGLMGVYAQVVPIWLEDDDPGLARTMAALDRRLRRGERWLGRLEALGGAACRLAATLAPRRASPPRDETPETPAPSSGNGTAEPSAG